MTKRKEPWQPCDYDYQTVIAMKALSEGKANADQQVKALVWIVDVAAAKDEEQFYNDHAGGDRNTAYACGKAYVGRQVAKLVNMSPKFMDTLRKKEETQNDR